ncbi:MAG: endolytic transglycosylase MltG, partial [Clostridia bacterium]|nr:endolytic transglycosylase MltG [Clostridia bacterium]
MPNEYNNKTIDEILDELQGLSPKTETPATPVSKKPAFQLNLNLDDEYGDPEPQPVAVKEPTQELPKTVTRDVSIPSPTPVSRNEKSQRQADQEGCLKAFLYAACVFLLSGVLTYFIVTGGLDFTGLNRSERMVDITVKEGADTKTIVSMLKEEGLIEQPAVFRLYILLTGTGKNWKEGQYSVSPNMGYKLLTRTLQAAKERESVSVLIPEGFTIDKIAKRLEQNKVCTAAEFYRAVNEVDYSKDYSFLKDSKKSTKYSARVYKLEGYLFPDTYQFYVGCSGETVVRKMLDNFNTRVGTNIRSVMSAKGVKMDDIIVLASIVQGEAANKVDMLNVARVLDNRLKNNTEFPKLQCDSTGDYIKKMLSGNS